MTKAKTAMLELVALNGSREVTRMRHRQRGEPLAPFLPRLQTAGILGRRKFE
jgi:hypothetical protein